MVLFTFWLTWTHHNGALLIELDELAFAVCGSVDTALADWQASLPTTILSGAGAGDGALVLALLVIDASALELLVILLEFGHVFLGFCFAGP